MRKKILFSFKNDDKNVNYFGFSDERLSGSKNKEYRFVAAKRAIKMSPMFAYPTRHERIIGLREESTHFQCLYRNMGLY